ncbi:MAG TPA: type I-E CRISPR-associated protein Cas6/Cse3/CasE [Anaerolineaceae bacterium]|jgi:CRISPR system Cascade subunit CasE|nr:type I-E CRISPR-associated protein Cas6/Cse3/CasE [Anaerolineaceae bacterium]HOU00565.1 type I-E CRISPR-associated protein Cas6/Cse3/CasE [Anaerolineaceae bacterium]HQF68341.1 type I-E CRISPR-associated protein Cas6/Cse3/CasE [Anaerolineaceae bacterium]HRT92681.1 type I-E CRISPR-associated protein Cas6/Cse3/CasE [Anaerolineaceae bacterium]
MYLALYEIKNSKVALGWIANRYRVHQRLRMAYRDEPRLLFRIEEHDGNFRILAQSTCQPDWQHAFVDFDVLAGIPAVKELRLENLMPRSYYHFRLVANPVVTRNRKRLGLFKEEAQFEWLKRQMERSGTIVMQAQARQLGLMRSAKNPAKDENRQTHYAVEFNGVLQVLNVKLLSERMIEGIGPAKAYGFGLLTLARFTA